MSSRYQDNVSGNSRQWNQGGRSNTQIRGEKYQKSGHTNNRAKHHDSSSKESWPRQQQLSGNDRRPQQQEQQQQQQQRKNPQSQQQPAQRQQQQPFKPPPPRPNVWGTPTAAVQPAVSLMSEQKQQQQAPKSAPIEVARAPSGQPHVYGTMGAWGNKLAKMSGSASPVATISTAPVLPKKDTGPPTKKPKSKHASNSKNQSITSKSQSRNNIHGKKPKLNSISMGDLIPDMKKILPRDKKKQGFSQKQQNCQQPIATQSRQNATNDDFPALPGSSQWPSLASNKLPAAFKPATTSNAQIAAAPKISTSDEQTKGNNNNTSIKKRKNPTQQKHTKKGNAKGKTNSKNLLGDGDRMKVDDAHRQAQLLMPPGKALLDHNHMQGQFDMRRAVVGGDALMLRMLGGQVAKGRQRIKPRKKRFTTLKRKVLLERLRIWKEMHPEDAKDSNSTGDNAAGHMSCTICVYGFASPDELEDDDEYEELVANLQGMASKVGTRTRVFIPRQFFETESSHAEYPAFVEFSAPGEAMAARGCWEGISIGGQTLHCIPITIPASSGVEIKNNMTDEEWQSQCLEAARESDIGVISKAVDSTDCRVVLKDVLTEDDLEDDECFLESIQDIQALVEKFGTVQDILARKQEGNLDVTVVYNGDSEVARHAAEGLRQLTIGGTQIRAEVISQTPAVQTSLAVSRILLENVLTQDDLEDDDCLEESLADVRSMLEQYGTVSSLDVTDVNIAVSFEAMSAEELDTVAGKLDGVCLGGQTIKASCFAGGSVSSNLPCVSLRNLLTQDDIDDEDCLEESLDDVRELAGQHGDVVSIDIERSQQIGNCLVRITYNTSSEAEAAAKAFQGLVMGGEMVLASTNLKSVESTPSAAEAPKSTEDNPSASICEPPKPMFSGDKRIPERFAECKRVPKVPNKGIPRNYAIMTNDDAVKPLLVEMLSELMRLQLRALNDPNAKNAKARRRVVAGLREVARGIRANKVKMVVMAHNLDEFGAIDEKLQEILDLAAEKEVPVLFELSKRLLGKAVNKTIKVSVVGVQSTDGAHRQFVELSKRAPHLIKPSSLVG